MQNLWDGLLVGIAAALSIFTIAGSILNISFDKIQEPEEFIKIIALAVLAGFAGISLLQKLSDNLLNKIRSNAEETSKNFKVIYGIKTGNNERYLSNRMLKDNFVPCLEKAAEIMNQALH